MADDKQHIGKPDRDRISLSEDYEVKYWATKLAVSSAELVDAVKVVGNNAKDVEEYLNKNKGR